MPVQFRATAVGCMNTAATAAGGLGVLLAAVLKRGLGLETVFAGLSGVFVAAALAMAVGYRACFRRDQARARRWEEDRMLDAAEGPGGRTDTGTHT